MQNTYVNVTDIVDAIIAKYGEGYDGCWVREYWFSPNDVIELIEEVAKDVGFCLEEQGGKYEDIY